MRIALSTLLLILAAGVHSSAQDSDQACPILKVVAPAGITAAGDKMTFALDIAGEIDISRVEIEWTIADGSIVQGQGTKKIQVAHRDGAKLVTAIAAVKGLPYGCLSEATYYAPVAYLECGPPSDDFGDIPLNDQLVRLDMFFAELMSDPKSTGFILLEFGEDSDSNGAKERVKRIIQHAEFRKFDKGRLIFGISKSERIRTVFWRIPEQGEMPSCDDCEIIKGWFQ